MTFEVNFGSIESFGVDIMSIDRSDYKETLGTRNMIDVNVYMNGTTIIFNLIRAYDKYGASAALTSVECRSLRRGNPLEWYFVTEWLGEMLVKYGEKVTEYCGHWVWSRMQAGQLLESDAVLREIANSLPR